MNANWWLSDGEGTAFGPYRRKEIETRLRRYRIYRRHSHASRRTCWTKAGKDPFVGSQE